MSEYLTAEEVRTADLGIKREAKAVQATALHYIERAERAEATSAANKSFAEGMQEDIEEMAGTIAKLRGCAITAQSRVLDIEMIAWGWDGDCGAERIAYDVADILDACLAEEDTDGDERP